MNGKGDNRRPLACRQEELDLRWIIAFGNEDESAKAQVQLAFLTAMENKN